MGGQDLSPGQPRRNRVCDSKYVQWGAGGGGRGLRGWVGREEARALSLRKPALWPQGSPLSEAQFFLCKSQGFSKPRLASDLLRQRLQVLGDFPGN